MLGYNGNESLERAQDRTVDDDWARSGPACLNSSSLVGRAVLEVEALWKLEVQLDRGALERSSESVTDLDVDLGAVERPVTGIKLPLAWI